MKTFPMYSIDFTKIYYRNEEKMHARKTFNDVKFQHTGERSLFKYILLKESYLDSYEFW